MLRPEKQLSVQGNSVEYLAGRGAVWNRDEFYMVRQYILFQVLKENIGLFAKESQINNHRIQISFSTDIEDTLRFRGLHHLKFFLL